MNIYLIGIGGTGVGALAGMLKQLGHRVTGSDEHLYPPMSDKLREWGIPTLEGYAAAHLTPPPDLVVVGNVIRGNNPEAVQARVSGVRTLSMPEAVSEFGIRDRHSIVVAGTHGKTTVTALIAHALMQSARDPSYLVGGALVGYPESFRVGGGAHFVVEGDEYDSAYFDKGPKFLHYQPRTTVITSLEYDHADIYPNIEAVEASFRDLIGKVPSDGRLVVFHGAERARRLVAAHARTERVTFYSPESRADAQLSMKELRGGPDGLSFEAMERGESLGRMQVPLWGHLAAENVLAAIGALREVGLLPAELRAALATFRGVHRRLELRGEPGGIAVVDDFGHHPTAVAKTLEAARMRWPGRRIWALFEPRSATSRRNVFQQEYVSAFADADHVVVTSHERLDEIPAAERFDPDRLVAELRARGIRAEHEPKVDRIVEQVASEARSGDVVLVFSNGAFGGIHGKLLKSLGNGAGRQA